MEQLLFKNFASLLLIILIVSNSFDYGTANSTKTLVRPRLRRTARSIVNGGVYKIQNDSDQMVLTAVDNGVVGKSLGKVQSQPWKSSGINDDQKWTIRTSPVSGKELRALSSRRNTNNNISFELKSGSSTGTIKYWEFVPVGLSPGKWQIKSYPGGQCLQSMGRDKNVEEKACSGTTRSQRWEILICNSSRCSDRSA